MRRQFAVAALLAGLALPSTLYAQFRGGARAAAPPRISGGFSGFRSAPRPIASGAFRPSPARTAPFRSFGRRPGGFHGRPGPSSPRFIPRIHFRNNRFFTGFGVPTSFWYAFPPYYPYYDDYGNDQTPAAAAEPYDSGQQQNDALVNQVQELTDEVESLHEQQASGQYSRASRAPQSGFEEKSVPAVFVYHDGHQLEAQNYAIMGQTLWVFGDEMTRKVPLAELDLAQTRKLNDERGIDFTPPELR